MGGALLKDVFKTVKAILRKSDRPVEKAVVFLKHRGRFVIKRSVQVGLSKFLK